MRIKIVSDGTVGGSKVVNAETGEQIENVRGIELLLSADTGVHCMIDVMQPEIDAECDVDPY